MKLKKDGKGIRISIPLAILFSLLIAMVPVVVAVGTYTEKINKLEQNDLEKTETIKSMEERLIVLEQIAAGTEVSLGSIKEDVTEMKGDIKDIARAISETRG